MIKPVRVHELLARIEVALRRMREIPTTYEVLRAGEIVLDERMHSVTVHHTTGFL